jgi:hypothetical protein
VHDIVLAGLDPAIHVPQAQAVPVLVDARPKAGQGDCAMLNHLNASEH